MLPSTSLHLAILPDGNGRWARARGKPRSAGHAAGARALPPLVAAAPELGVSTLTVFALSAANWQRPEAEVHGILSAIASLLRDNAPGWTVAGVRVRALGRRDRLPQTLRAAIAQTEADTGTGQRLHLNFLIDYSAREMIFRAASRFYSSLEVTPQALGRVLAWVEGASEPLPDVDLLIRTGGEQRLSDCLLWEAANAEMVFSRKWWPDFRVEDLAAAVEDFHKRQRTFGSLPVAG